MHRGNDQTGVSGIGKVGEGVVFSDGRTVFRWCARDPHSTVTYDSFDDFMLIHVTPHPENDTRIVELFP